MPAAATPGTPVPPAYKLCALHGVEVFEDGIYRGRPYSDAEIDEFVRNFERFGPRGLNLLTPPVVLGHEEDQRFLDKWEGAPTDLPAAGVVGRLYRGGPLNKLLADFVDVPVPVGSLINAKAYRKCSIEHFDRDRPFDAGNGQVFPELILRRIALLGGEVPQVKALADLPVAVFSYGDRRVAVYAKPSGGACFAFSDSKGPTVTINAAVLNKLKASKWAKAFADGVDRAMLEEKLKPLFPGITDWAAFDDNQMAMLALGCTAAPAAPATPPTMADPVPLDRPAIIAELVAQGQDATALEAMTDDDLRALYTQLTGNQFKDRAPAKPTPPAVQHADRQAAAALAQTHRLNAELEAANRRSLDRLKAARKTEVHAFCDTLVKEGRLLPAQRDKVERDLLKADDVTPAHQFADNGRTVSLTEYERDRRELSQWPVVVKFGERLRTGDDRDKAATEEVAKVVRFCDLNGDSMKAHGSDPKKLIELAKKKAEADKGFTAASLIGADAAAMVS